MLDTNVVSDLIRHPTGFAAQRVRVVGGSVCVSIIVAAELRYGCAKRGSRRLSCLVEAFLAEVPVLPFSAPADGEYGRIRADLEGKGMLIGPNDLLIAAHACALGATLVTANVTEFARVEGLVAENWLSS